mgnify:FL=1
MIEQGDLTVAEYRDLLPPAVSHKAWQRTVLATARQFGWKPYWTWYSVHSPAGFPDLVLVRLDRLVFAELKTETGKITPAQQEWLDILEPLAQEGRIEVYVWRPSQFEEVATILR